MKKILIIVVMLFGMMLLSVSVNAVSKGTPGTFCIQVVKMCPDGSYATRNADCSFNACPNTTNTNYKDTNAPCSSVSLIDKGKCCVDKGYTTYSEELNTCIIRPLQSDGTIVLFNKTYNASQFKHEVEEMKYSLKFNQTIVIKALNNTEMRNRIEQIANKTQEKYRVRMAQLENLTFTITSDGIVVASGKFDAKLFGFMKFKHKYFCKISEDGSATRKHAMWDIFIKDTNVNPCGDKVVNNTTITNSTVV